MTARTKKQNQLMHIARRTLEAVSPAPALHAALKIEGDVLTVDGRRYDLARYDRVFVLGAGKASAAMAETMESILGPRLHRGLVATKYGHGVPLRATEIMESGHPVPDEAGHRAARAILDLAGAATQRDLVFFLLSGGASALVPAPRDSVTLAAVQDVTRRLLECGATINEINAVRKHLSAFKGGQLARALAPATVVTLIISDVVGDHLDVIGSGPTAPDGSTYLDCMGILEKFELCGRIPPEVEAMISAGCAGRAPETCKQGEACFSLVQNVVISGNAMAVDGAARAAGELGYAPVVVDSAMQGEARDVAVRMMRLAGEYGAAGPVCLLAGGETTVTIQGQGKGGRNQEFALAAALELSGMQGLRERVAVMSLGTDGTDGPTDAAGAMVLPHIVPATAEQSAYARGFLMDNNSYEFFDGAGALIRTGPTRTNVMDVVAILVDRG
ncbi:glycerate kinase type-2 family protein [Desulfocurvus sp. DL9XJH121]